jgi:hypothetical protein
MVSSSVSAIAADRSQGIPADHRAKIWRIPYDDAARTLEVTTQLLNLSTIVVVDVKVVLYL